MKLTQPHQPHDSDDRATGLFGRIGRFFRRSAPDRKPVLVKVWDGARGQYREVDLLNREDPLWFAAKSLAGVQRNLTQRTAA